MEKQFSITFDLSKMQVLIPSGRLMNLKQSLNWDDIDCNKEELQKLTQQVSNHDFQVNMDFGNKGQSFVNQVMNGKYHKEARRESYNQRGVNYILNTTKFNSVTEKLTEELKMDLGELFEEVKLNPEVAKKMQKLAQLKLMNN